MRKLLSILGLVFSCVLAQSAAVNWTNRVANIQAETNGYFGRSVNIGAGFADAWLYPDSGPAVTPFRLQSSAIRLSGNIFEVSNGPGFLTISSGYDGLLSAPDLLLTGDASVQGGVLADHIVVTNGIIASNLTASVNGVLNVKSAPFNAKGDGIVDDTAALQLAINTATANTPVLGVYIPAGVYKITSTITITNSTDITGAGTGNHEVTPGHITVIQKAANFTAFKLEKRHIALRKLTVQGYAGSGDTTSGIQVGDLTTDAGDAILDDVTVRLCGADGIWVQNGNCCHLRVQTWGNLGNGLRLESTVVASDNVNANVVDLVSTSNSGDGLRMVKSAVNMVKVVSQGNGGYGIYNGYPNSMIEAYTEGNTSGSYYGTASAFSGTLSGKFNEGDPVMVNRYNVVQNSNSTNSWFRFLYNIATPTNLVIETDAEVQGAVRMNNGFATNGIVTTGLTNSGVTVHTPSAIQTLAAGTIIAWDSSTERVAGSGGAVTLTGTPTIQTNGVPDGALITIRGTSDANTVTLQDYRLLAGTCIAMEVGSVTLRNGSEIRFQWSAANQKWQQIAFSANSSQNHVFANATVDTNLTLGSALLFKTNLPSGFIFKVPSQTGIATNLGVNFTIQNSDNGNGTWNTIAGWGYNMTASSVETLGQTAIGWRIEGDWENGGHRYSEAHLSYFSTNNLEHRLLGFAADHDVTNSYTGSIGVSSLSIKDDVGTYFQFGPNIFRMYNDDTQSTTNFSLSHNGTSWVLNPGAGTNLDLSLAQTCYLPKLQCGQTSVSFSTTASLLNGVNLVSYDAGGNTQLQIGSGNINIASNKVVTWATAASGTGTKSLGLAQDYTAANTSYALRVSDGSTGYGALKSGSIQSPLTVGQTTYIDASKKSQTNQVAGALTFAHCTNGIDAVSIGLNERWFFNSSGSDQTLTFPMAAARANGWIALDNQAVPPAITNGTAMLMLYRVIGPTDTLARQTNCIVSFHYF